MYRLRRKTDSGPWRPASPIATCNGNRNAAALLELHIIAMLIGQRIFNAEITIPMAGAVNSNLCLFRLARTWRNDFGDGAGHGCAWLFRNSRSI